MFNFLSHGVKNPKGASMAPVPHGFQQIPQFYNTVTDCFETFCRFGKVKVRWTTCEMEKGFKQQRRLLLPPIQLDQSKSTFKLPNDGLQK